MRQRRVDRRLAALAATALAACAPRADGGPGIVHAVTIQPQAAALCVGDSLAFTAQALDAGGHPVSGAQIRWASSAPEAVAIDTASGVAHALKFGAGQITASAGGVRSATPAELDVPSDLLPEFVPDSLVLAPGDTMTLGVRLRRASGGLVPAEAPLLTPVDSPSASLAASGLATAKAQGRTPLTLAACGFTGHGLVSVFTPSDAATGQAYLWLSGPVEVRVSLPALANNFSRTNGRPAFQVFSLIGPAASPSRFFVYEDTVTLAGVGLYALDSLFSTEASQATLACAPPRPFATYSDQAQATVLLSMTGGSTRITTFTPQSGYTAISGRAAFQMRGVVGGVPQLYTLQGIYTFSAPLVTNPTACH